MFLLSQPSAKMLPKCSPNPPKIVQVTPKMAPKPPKLRPDGHLDAIVAHLGRNLLPSWPNFAHLARNFPVNSRPSAPETTNRGQRPIQTPIFIDFGPLLVTIFVDFGIDPNIFGTCLIYVCTGFAQLVRLLIGAAPVVSRSVFNPAQHLRVLL